MAVNITTSYEGQVLERLLVRASTGNELVSGGHIHIEPNVEKKFFIPRLKATQMLQKRVEQPDETNSKGNFNIDEKVLEPKDLMAFTTFNPRSFEKFWRPFQPTGNLVFRELPAEAQTAMLDAMAKTLHFELGFQFINGVFGAGADQFFDGILTRIVASAEVVKIASATELTEATILPALKSVKDSIPAPLFADPNLKIFMSRADFNLYDDVLTNKPYKGADYTNMNPERYKGIRLVPLAAWPSGVIVAACTSPDENSNFWAGVALANDPDVILIDKLTNAGEKYFFKMLMKADTNIVFDEDIVLYDGRTVTPDE